MLNALLKEWNRNYSRPFCVYPTIHSDWGPYQEPSPQLLRSIFYCNWGHLTHAFRVLSPDQGALLEETVNGLPYFFQLHELKNFHALRVHYAHAAANLNSGYPKYAKVARVHYFCTIALRTSRAVLTGNYISLVIFKWLLNLLKCLIYHIIKDKKSLFTSYMN